MVSSKNYNQNQFTQSIKFYKIIAITFLVLTLFLLGTILFMSSKSAEIIILTSSDPVEVNSTILIGEKNDYNIDAFVTSTIIDFSNTFYPEGEKTILAKSEGKVILYNKTESDQTLVATTRLLTAEGILFRLKNRVNIPAGGETEAEVIADEEGLNGNIAPADFIIPGLREEKQKLIYAKSTEAMTGGTRKLGMIGEKDVSNAEVLLIDFLKEKAKDVFKEQSNNKEALYEVVQYVFENNKKLGEEADNFILTGKATVAAVFYDKEDVNNYAYELLNREVASNNEILQSTEKEVSLTIKRIDLEKNEAELNLGNYGLVNIDQNSRELQKIMFLGKSEEEVKRYVMSIKHVKGVEMNFKPVWMRTIPHVADNVSIVIREE